MVNISKRLGLIMVLIILFAIVIFNTMDSPSDEDNMLKNSSNEVYASNYYNTDPYASSENLHFDHMPITYSFNEVEEKTVMCNKYQTKRVGESFEKLQNLTEGLMSFKQVEDNGDITIDCYKAEVNQDGFGTAGEGQYFSQGLVIVEGKMNFYARLECAKGDVEIHEIFHILGFGHNESLKSIMNPISSCGREIDKNIIDKLKRIYSG